MINAQFVRCRRVTGILRHRHNIRECGTRRKATMSTMKILGRLTLEECTTHADLLWWRGNTCSSSPR